MFVKVFLRRNFNKIPIKSSSSIYPCTYNTLHTFLNSLIIYLAMYLIPGIVLVLGLSNKSALKLPTDSWWRERPGKGIPQSG